jgi:hypothetical protein
VGSRNRQVTQIIGAFFREIYRADELGSGMRKMMRHSKAYGGADPGRYLRTALEFGIIEQKNRQSSR